MSSAFTLVLNGEQSGIWLTKFMRANILSPMLRIIAPGYIKKILSLHAEFGSLLLTHCIEKPISPDHNILINGGIEIAYIENLQIYLLSLPGSAQTTS
jgi:hypothetical protein